ncbi:MAG: BREX-1 system adenine-specific DNA-methyltransferase PglX [Methanobrevibacter ruminantium]|uniref:BREX-1 system adenine-specific DNA-methyltransferase PglX n=1 Tax=Methanobrevibacter ruminantium TaxID=83816 RepID=UPI0026EABFE6|nr:BREX-1 system adenine-specific DNA-methyltransferase PglX [Methanobrevibacter ruminantium]MDD6049274.1 BREX-1 system adenine-specific DNA-methyltransferase PglX [Methanobrevibacter ruminantium]
MDKSKLRTFAIESRRKLIEDTKYQASLLGISNHETKEPVSSAEGMETYQISSSTTHTIYDKEIEQRKHLVREIEQKGFDQVIEEVAYTWFNRIIAIRYMEVNDYLPTRTRVLSSETPGKIEPDIITEALDLDLDYSDEDINKILELKESNKLDELFKLLFIKQCNKLNDILPYLFEKTSDFTELLLNISFNNSEGIVQGIINSIPEEYFTEQVEIIGWMYQFYNTELKDDTFKNIKKNKVSKERIPAITQLFTPDWIVKYMVENSIGRLWLNKHPNDDLKSNWKYYLEDAEQDETVYNELRLFNDKNINLEEIKILDPCMGSGHILVYAFDVLMQIYLSQGYSEKDAAVSILENNIYGLDIDDRAYQLAYFALMMKARQYNRRILTKNITPNVVALHDSNISENALNFISNNDDAIKKDLIYLMNTFKDAKEFGSLIRSKKLDFDGINEFIVSDLENKKDTLEYYSYIPEISSLKNILLQANLLSQEYDVVITNPPYMANRSMKKEFSEFLKKNYVDSKSDLFATFIERCQEMLKPNGYSSMITMQSFMFLSTFEKLRMKFLEDNLINMVHLGSGAFEEIGGEVVQTTAFVRRNSKIKDFKTTFVRLVDTKDKEKNLFNKDLTFETSINNFNQIPGSPIAYWADKHVFEAFQKGTPLIDIGDIKQGLATADNNRFLRQWFEVNNFNINFSCESCVESKNSNLKWYPYNKGGDFKKWYGNQNYVVNWLNDGYEIRNFRNSAGKLKSRPQNSNFYFHESLSWSKISSGSIGFRFFPKGFLFDVAGCSVFVDKNKEYILGFLNSTVSKDIFNLISPTLNYEVGHVSSVPLIFNENEKIGIYLLLLK